MTNEEAKALLDKYNKGLASPSEAALLQYWFIYKASQNEADADEHQLEQIVMNMRKEVMVQTIPGNNKRLWPRFAGVAAAVVAIVVGVWVYTTTPVNLNQNDIGPGKNTATLTLANGKIITLSDAKTGIVIEANQLMYNDGSVVEHGDAGLRKDGDALKQLIVSTPRGGTYCIVLPDGTKVWLNADSKLEFPSNFKNVKQRFIKLTGEGYFEVAKVYLNTPLKPRRLSGGAEDIQKRMPFIVETKNQRVEVLGTHFNINSYADEPDTKTTLLEGSVKVTGKSQPIGTAGVSEMILKPGQQALLDRNFAIQLKKVLDLEYVIAWRTSGAGDPGSLVFFDEPIESVMRKISRWYDVTIAYKIDLKKDLRFSGVVRKDVKLQRVLDLLETSGSVHFKIEGRRVVVTK